MQLESIVVGMRPRTGWEAIDLGFSLVRHAARDIYAALVVVMLPVAIAATVIAYAGELWLAALFLWWVKPLIDAVTLSVLARAIIGERTRIRHTFFAAPVALQHHLVGALTIRRLSPSRTFTMPVRHLERLSSKAARERIKTLTLGRRGNAQLAAGLLLGIELALWLAGFQAYSMFSATEGLVRESLVPDDVPIAMFVLVVIAAQLLVEPVFSAIGFALYINRRVELEGWDLELAFRALRTRAARKIGKVSALVASLFVLALPLAASAQEKTAPSVTAPSVAASSVTAPAVVVAPKKAIKEVLSNPDFDPWRPTDRWMRIDTEESKPDEPEVAQDDGLNFFAIGAIIAQIMPYLLGAIAAILAVHLTLIAVRARMSQSTIDVRRDLDDGIELITAKTATLPDNVAQFALDAWGRGEYALGLSILYRGGLAYFAATAIIDFPEGATEQECIALVRTKVTEGPARDAFAAVARAWQRCAYAHRLPSGDDFKGLADLYAKAFVIEPRVAA